MTEADWLACTDPIQILDYLRGPASLKKIVFDRPITGYCDKKISDRKSRLIGCGMCRRYWHLLDEDHCQRLIDFARSYRSIAERGLTEPPLDCCHKAIELAERSADEAVSADELNVLSDAASVLFHPISDYCASYGEEVGPFDFEFVASGQAAQAVSYAAGQRYDMVFDEPSEAFDSLHSVVDWMVKAASDYGSTVEGTPSSESAAKEQIAQCELLRDVVGNPFRPVTLEPSCLTWNDGAVVDLAQIIYDERAFERMSDLADILASSGCTDDQVLEHCRQPGEHVRGCWVVDLVLGKQ